jgi:hypothetical protein
MTEPEAKEIHRLARLHSRSRKRRRYNPQRRLADATLRAGEKGADDSDQKGEPEGYITLREIENSLYRRMWAGFGRAELAAQILRDYAEEGKRALDFGPRRDHVVAALREAFLSGKLTLFVVLDKRRWGSRPVPDWANNPTPVPKELLGHVFISVKGRMPGDFAIRPGRKAAGSDRMFVLASYGRLIVRDCDFRRWLALEKRKRRWPSQRKTPARTKRGVGRPRRQESRLKNRIQRVVSEGAWNGQRPLTELRRMLSREGEGMPSVDTIGRLVDESFAETGKPGLRRHHRRRRR